ncbi:MAG: N-methyl-L-tryptophan oxidase [Jatrophihabitantaceae bacterium]
MSRAAGQRGRYDVIVLGLGGMGSAAARQLARRGAAVLGLEQFTPAHALGSSHGDTRIVRTAYFEHPDYVPLLRRAYRLWDELGAAIGRPLLVRTGALMIGAPDSAVVTGTLASAHRWDLAHELLDAGQLRQRYPQFRLRSHEVAVFEADAGYVDPEDTVRAHLTLARRDGAELRFGAKVTAWRPDGDGVLVDFDGGRARARSLVLAAGAWTAALAPGLGVPLRVGRRVMHYLSPRTDAAQFDAIRFPVYFFDTGPGDGIYGFPLVGEASNGVKVGFHYRGGDADPDTVNREVSAAERDEMRALLAERIPDLAGEHVDARVCMYTLTPDENFVIDLLPGSSGRVTVAAGFSGHGFKFTPVVGEILADLALSGATEQPIDFLSATRFTR